MTENEVQCAINNLKAMYQSSLDKDETYLLAIKALEEIQVLEKSKTYHIYRECLSIGTVEELRALKEKAEPKKPIIHGLGQRYCPVCKCGGADHFYCTRCGQKLV